MCLEGISVRYWIVEETKHGTENQLRNYTVIVLKSSPVQNFHLLRIRTQVIVCCLPVQGAQWD